MPRLVVTDVDGTLIDHDGRLPEPRAAAVRRLVDAGVPVVLATGKIWPSVEPLWTRLGLAGPHIACNGAAVVRGDGTPYELRPLDDEVAATVAARLRELRIPHATYLEDGTIVATEPWPELHILEVLGEPAPILGDPDGRRVLKVLSVLPEEDEGELRSLAADVARVQRTSHRFLEWNAPGVDKASGLAVLAELLGVRLEDIVAIGDAENDGPMLELAGEGVAVAGASDAAVRAADRRLTVDLADELDALAHAARRTRP